MRIVTQKQRRWGKQTSHQLQSLLKTALVVITLLVLTLQNLFETVQGEQQVSFTLDSNKLICSDSSSYNSTIFLNSCQEVLGSAFTSKLSSTTIDNPSSYSSLVSCYFNSDKKLVAELGYGYEIQDIFKGETYYDAFGRKIAIIIVSQLKCSFQISKLQYMYLINVVDCGSNVAKITYSLTHANADLPKYSTFSHPMMAIPFSNNYINNGRPDVTFNLATQALTYSTSKASDQTSVTTGGVIEYGTTTLVGNQGYTQFFLNESSIDSYTTTFEQPTPKTLYNYLLIKQNRDVVDVTTFASGYNYKFSSSSGYSKTIYTSFSYKSDCYYLSGGDKTHHKTQDLTISIQSTDLERCPLYALQYIFDGNAKTKTSSTTYAASSLTDGSEKTVTVTLVQPTGGYVGAFRTTVRIGIFPAMMRPVYFPIAQTTGQKLTLQSIIDIPNLTTSLISCQLIVATGTNEYTSNSITYDYTPNSIQVQNYKTYSIISVSITVGNPGTSYKIRVNYNGDTKHYNDFQISPQSKPNLLGICKVSTVESNPIAYETFFGIYCENYADFDFRSMKIQVLNDQSQSILTLSNTKYTRIFARLPKSATGKSNTVLFTLTDSTGAVFEFKDTYKASMWSDTNLISTVDFYIKSKQVRNYQTANNIAILLDILADYCKRNTLSSSEMVTVKGIVRYAINETFNIRDTFHPNVYPEATELLFGLFRESTNLANYLGFSEFNDKLKEILSFMTSYVRKSSFSSTDYNFLIDYMSRLVDNGNQTTTDPSAVSTLKKNIDGLTNIASKNSPFKSDYFSYQSQTFYSSDEIASNQVNLENSWVRVLFGSEVANLVKSQSQYDLETSLYKKYIVENNVTLPVIASISLKRQDSSVVNVTGLQTPVLIYFNMDLINSTMANQYRNYQSRISCYYLNELTSKWANDGLTTEIITENGQTVVKCSSTHLTSFTIFSDLFNTTGSNTNTPSTDRNGLDVGARVAIGVSISVFFLILIIVIVIIIIVIICCRVKKGKNSQSNVSDSVQETNPITKSYVELNPVSNSDSGPSLFISDYKSVREPSSSKQYDTTSGSSFTSEPTSSLMTSTSGNSVIGKKYEILEKIGQGAFGAVFRAKNLAYTGRSGEYQYVAIKKIQLSGLSEMNDKFKEAVNMFKIRNEHLVCLEDAVVDETTMSLYLVMQYYSQGDLDKFIKSKQLLSESILKQIIEQVCEGLKYLEEERNMLHRDIKPSNIFLSSYDGNNIKTVLSDFGLAKENNMMSSVSFAGTPYYMSPQALIGTKYSFNADIFSLGCTIFILITHDMSQSIAQLYFQHQGNFSEVYSFITNSIRQHSNEQFQYSDEFVQLLLQLMEFDPNKRPNASGVLKLLKNLE